jgi:hypothetical protein
MPIAFVFSVQLVLSNTAYLNSSMAFLQMMKESNLVLVYAFSLVGALETFGWTKVKIIVMMLCATGLTIHGEVNFSMKGFVIQATGQLFESSKIVLQVLLLSSAGRKLDVLTYVLLVMPACFLVLGCMLFFLTYVHPMELFATPLWSDVVAWWPILFANANLAFALNVAIALLMKEVSAVGYILAGVVKDTFIVVVGAAALHEPIALLQCVGFSMQLFFVCTWSLMKTFPDKFENGLVQAWRSMLLPADDKEALPQVKEGTGYGTVEK